MDFRQIFVVKLALILNLYNVNGERMINILQWQWFQTNTSLWSRDMGQGQEIFMNNKCAYQNCYITSQTDYIDNVDNFDVILFHGADLKEPQRVPIPRNEKIKYIYTNPEPASVSYLHPFYDNFFNLTWTYRLDSDIRIGYITVRGKRNGKVVGPKKNKRWIKLAKMKPIKKSIKRKLEKKRIAAAWFVSNCKTQSRREEFVFNFKRELAHFGHEVDIFGACGDYKCPIERIQECWAKLESDYFFYLAFESAFADDYVSEKILHGLKHFAVPIVYGGADYSRFMPDGIYLNALELGAKKLAEKVNETIWKRKKYYDFFKWHRYYTFHSTSEYSDTDEFCQLCAFLNDESKFNQTSTRTELSSWWNNGAYLKERIDILSKTVSDTDAKILNVKRKKTKKNKGGDQNTTMTTMNSTEKEQLQWTGPSYQENIVDILDLDNNYLREY